MFSFNGGVFKPTIFRVGQAVGMNGTGTVSNEPPVNILPSDYQTPQDVPVEITGLSVSDEYPGTIEVTLTATNGVATLGTLTGLSFSVGDGTNDSLMTFSGTLANVNAALASVLFTPTASFFGTASLQIVSNDGTFEDDDTISIDLLS